MSAAAQQPQPLDADTIRKLASMGYRVETLDGAPALTQQQPAQFADHPDDPAVWKNDLGVTSARQESFEIPSPVG